MNVNGSFEEREWHSGLYDCCSGWDSTILCLQGLLTPCWLFGDNMNIMRGDGCCGPCCLCCHFPCCGAYYAANTRRQIRQRYGIREGPYSDKFIWTYCSCCATCQEGKEIQAHAAKKASAGNTTTQPASTLPPAAQTMDSKPIAAGAVAGKPGMNHVKPAQ